MTPGSGIMTPGSEIMTTGSEIMTTGSEIMTTASEIMTPGSENRCVEKQASDHDKYLHNQHVALKILVTHSCKAFTWHNVIGPGPQR